MKFLVLLLIFYVVIGYTSDYHMIGPEILILFLLAGVDTVKGLLQSMINSVQASRRKRELPSEAKVVPITLDQVTFLVLEALFGSKMRKE